jgi:predicted porin
VFGVTAPVTATFNVFAMMGTGELQMGSTAYNGDIEGTQVGANYALSKRTTAKFAYGTTKRDTSASASTKVKEYAFGLVHTF